MHYIYTDAGHKGVVSNHAYLIFDDEFNFVYGLGKNSNHTSTFNAEKHSIKMALNRARALNIKEVTLFTDCISCAKGDYAEAEEAMNHMKLTLKWIPREQNKLADALCRMGHKKFFSKMNNVLGFEIKCKDVSKPTNLTPNAISKHTLSQKEKQELLSLLIHLTNNDSDNLSEFFEWASDRLSENTYNGRKYLVKQFIEYKYLTSEQDKWHLKMVCDKKKLIEDYLNFDLHEYAYNKYKKVTKKNKAVGMELAKKKLFRNVQLSKPKLLEDDVIDYHYGCLSIKVKNNQVIDVEKLPPRKSSWRVSGYAYDELNSILNIG